MFNKEDILNKMLDGATADELAKEFTDALNAAVAEKQENDKMLAAEHKMSGRIHAVQDWLCATVDMLMDVFPDEVEDLDPEKICAGFDTATVRAWIEQIDIELAKAHKKLTPFSNFDSFVTLERAGEKRKKDKDQLDDAITKFLKSEGLL